MNCIRNWNLKNGLKTTKIKKYNDIDAEEEEVVDDDDDDLELYIHNGKQRDENPFKNWLVCLITDIGIYHKTICRYIQYTRSNTFWLT